MSPVRSLAVQKFISRKHGFIEKWALLIFLFVLIMLLTGTWFIKYPEIIDADAVLTSENDLNEGSYYAKVNIRQVDLGRIRSGQKVQLRLEAYPFQEFGFVEGETVDTMPVSPGNETFIRVILPNNLNTTYKRKIPFKDGLKAKAIIIIREQRLMERFLKKKERI